MEQSRMTQDDVLFGYRLQLFDLAARTTVTHACRTFGVHRSTYYVWKRQVDRHGLEMLRPRERRRPQMPNQLPKMIEERIVSFSLAQRDRARVRGVRRSSPGTGRSPPGARTRTRRAFRSSLPPAAGRARAGAPVGRASRR